MADGNEHGYAPFVHLPRILEGRNIPANDDRPGAAPTPAQLRRIAGERFFERGEAYLADGAVGSLRRTEGGVEGKVQGTRTYRVRPSWNAGELAHECTCPVGEERLFCKHCVAVGLAWYRGDPEPAEPELGPHDLRAWLSGLDREALVDLLLDHAAKDERLQRKLLAAAALAKGSPADLAVWKKAFAAALEADDFVPYREAEGYAAGIGDVVDQLDDLLRQGRAESVIALAEHGLAEIEEVLDHIDDSDGWMGDLLDRLQALHLEACRLARPDPVALAERLFEWEMETDFGVFHCAAETYAEILGEAGLATYRRLARGEWAKVRPLGPGEDDADRYGWRFRITSIVEAIATADGDLEALVAVKSRDLSRPYDFLGIASLYRNAGASEHALAWAERGWRAFPVDQQDPRLRAFLAEAWQAAGRRDEAMALIWEAFATQPRIETWQQLEKHAEAAGCWPVWREKAVALIGERIDAAPAPAAGRLLWQRDAFEDRSLLVEIFLHENDLEAAWREAEAGGCTAGLWLTLAKRREKRHPGPSIEVYRRHVEALLRNTGDGVYREAVGFLERIGKLYVRQGEGEAFRVLLTDLRATQRRKRKLMQMLDEKGW